MIDSTATRAILMTPSGTGAIGVVRLTGPEAASIAARVFEPARDSAERPGRLRFGSIVIEGERLDDVLLSSTTIRGEPVVDLCTHGGVRILERLLDALGRLGAELGPVANAPVCPWPVSDLVQYEAACGLSTVRTKRAATFLARQFETLSPALRALATDCLADPERAAQTMAAMIDRFPRVHHLLSGAVIALIGPANSGKSTLFNRLVGRPATIVSPTPGTTRDWVSEGIEIAGIPVDLIDTAGVRDAVDQLEQVAVGGGREKAAQADLRLLCVDGSIPLSDTWPKDLASWKRHGPALIVQTKGDLPAAWRQEKLPAGIGTCVSVSARTGEGLSELADAIERSIAPPTTNDRASGLFCPRQVDVMQSAQEVLARSPEQAARLIAAELLGDASE